MFVLRKLIPGSPAAITLLVAALVTLTTIWPAAASPVNAADAPPVLVAKSPYDLETTLTRLKAAAEGNNFRVIREQTVDFGLVDQNEEDRQQRILYFCNFDMLYDALQVDKRVGVFLPCQVNVTQRDDGVYVIAPNSKLVSAAYLGNPDLAPACDHLHQAYQAILEEGTL